MKLSNRQIMIYIESLTTSFNSDNIKDIYIPVKINYYIQKNIHILNDLVDSIEESRLNIIKHYGVLNEDGTKYEIPSEEVNTVNHELDNLFNLTQNVEIHQVKLSDMKDLSLNFAQMNALMFMIIDDTEEEE